MQADTAAIHNLMILPTMLSDGAARLMSIA